MISSFLGRIIFTHFAVRKVVFVIVFIQLFQDRFWKLKFCDLVEQWKELYGLANEIGPNRKE